MDFLFKPFNLRSWRLLFKNSGPLGYASILIIFSGKVFDTRSSGDVVSGSLSGSMTYRALLITGAILFLLPYFKFLRIPKGFGIRMGLLYVVVSVVSVSWSFVPIATLGKSLELLIGALLVTVALNSRYNLQRILSIFNIVIYVTYVQLVVIFFAFILGADGFSEQGAGGLADFVGLRITSPFISANGIGYLLVLILTILLNAIVFDNKTFSSMSPHLILSFLTLILSTSRTSLVILLFSILIILYFKNKRIFTFVLIPLLIITFFLMGDYIFSSIQGETASSNFNTLSGRTVLWQYALNLIVEHPWLGMGFGVGSRVMFFLAQLSGFSDTISTAHNGFLEVLSGIGLLGFIPWLSAFVYMLLFCIQGYSNFNFKYAYFMCIWPILLVTTIMSVGVGGAFGGNTMLFFLLLSFASIIKNGSNPNV